MGCIEKALKFSGLLGKIAAKRIQRSNEKTIAYVKGLKSLADGELRKIVSEENSFFVRDYEKIRAAKFILCNRN